MHTLQHQMPAPINPHHSLLRRASPRQKDNALFPLPAHGLYHFLREPLPALACMTIRFVCAHGQTGIEEQHTAVGPGCQESGFVGRRLEVGIVSGEGDVDVL